MASGMGQYTILCNFSTKTGNAFYIDWKYLFIDWKFMYRDWKYTFKFIDWKRIFIIDWEFTYRLEVHIYRLEIYV